MKKYSLSFVIYMCAVFYPFMAGAQGAVDRQLIWERNLIDIGSVMQEDGEVYAEFFFVNKSNFPIFIEEVITECGCTTASYTTDTLALDKIGSVKISYDPTDRGGPFSKMIIVKTNIDSEGDSLFLEGYNIPFPEDIPKHYSYGPGGIGFNSNQVNMGNVFTNEPKIKQIDFFNDKDAPLMLDREAVVVPDHIEVKLSPLVIQPKSRGILEIYYDGGTKDDLGFFEDQIEIAFTDKEEPSVPFRVTAVVHEYFGPISRGELPYLPKLTPSELEVDLNRISSNMPVSKIITLTNNGGAPLNIRKIVSNCECLVFSLEKNDLEVGETVDLLFTFDPKGRKGIDHKRLSIFSNDPLNPTKTIVIRSRIQ